MIYSDRAHHSLAMCVTIYVLESGSHIVRSPTVLRENIARTLLVWYRAVDLLIHNLKSEYTTLPVPYGTPEGRKGRYGHQKAWDIIGIASGSPKKPGPLRNPKRIKPCTRFKFTSARTIFICATGPVKTDLQVAGHVPSYLTHNLVMRFTTNSRGM